MATIENKGGNKWILKVSDGYEESGKRRRLTKKFEGTEKQAQRAAILFEEEIKNGQYCELGKNFTLSEFTKIWIKDYGDKHLAPATLERYRGMLETRILPLIGHLKMDKIKPLTINRWLNELSEMPRRDGKEGVLSDQSIKHHYRCLSAIMQDAVEWDVISQNPCARVKTPQVKKKQVECFEENEVETLIDLLEGEPLKNKALVYLAIASGAREGEIMGLEWKHLDFTKNTITIEQSSQYIPGKGTFTKTPKNESSVRTIDMPENVMLLLKTYRMEWLERKMEIANLWQGSERLFVTWDGKPGYPGYPGKWFNKFVRKHGLRHLTFHSLRHLSITILLNSNMPIKNVSKRAGHTVVGTTTDTYGHTLQRVDRTAADILGKTFEKSKIKNGHQSVTKQ